VAAPGGREHRSSPGGGAEADSGRPQPRPHADAGAPRAPPVSVRPSDAQQLSVRSPRGAAAPHDARPSGRPASARPGDRRRPLRRPVPG
jgi:hypothetical protein